MLSNCLLAGFRRWWREGGQFSMQPSRYGSFTHFTYRPQGSNEWEEFVPKGEKFQHKFPPLIFDGCWTKVTEAPPDHSFKTTSRWWWVFWYPILILLYATMLLWVGFTELLRWD